MDDVSPEMQRILDYIDGKGASDKFTEELEEAAKRSGHYTIALEEIEGCIADQKTVEDEIEARELARIIEAFLDTLTVKERVIFMRRYWYADSFAEIGKLLGITEGNARLRLTRMRKQLKTYLTEQEVLV